MYFILRSKERSYLLYNIFKNVYNIAKTVI